MREKMNHKIDDPIEQPELTLVVVGRDGLTVGASIHPLKISSVPTFSHQDFVS
jgi:hypothetical protein